MTTLSPALLTSRLKAAAYELGFSLAGVAPAVTPPGMPRFDEWLARGYAGQMQYLADRREAYEHPRHVLEGVRSVLMLAMNYCAPEAEDIAPIGAGFARVARYAQGSVDYHDLIHDRLHKLADWLRAESPGCSARGVVDTAPLLEREFAQLAGLGWIGKNTLLLNREAGSWFFLAALLTDAELECDAPHAADHCGTCRACLDACPTAAFPEPYVLDASRCISYLTIELRDAIPTELREGMGDWLFGCDVCQEVCPWNRKSPETSESQFLPLDELNPMDAIELLSLDEAAFRARFRHTPLWRPRRKGLLRNAAIVLGNRPTPAAVPALIAGLADPEPLVRAACVWALRRYDDSAAISALDARRAIETDPAVLAEFSSAPSPFGRGLG